MFKYYSEYFCSQLESITGVTFKSDGFYLKVFEQDNVINIPKTITRDIDSKFMKAYSLFWSGFLIYRKSNIKYTEFTYLQLFCLDLYETIRVENKVSKKFKVDHLMQYFFSRISHVNRKRKVYREDTFGLFEFAFSFYALSLGYTNFNSYNRHSSFLLKNYKKNFIVPSSFQNSKELAIKLANKIKKDPTIKNEAVKFYEKYQKGKLELNQIFCILSKNIQDTSEYYVSNLLLQNININKSYSNLYGSDTPIKLHVPWTTNFDEIIEVSESNEKELIRLNVLYRQYKSFLDNKFNKILKYRKETERGLKSGLIDTNRLYRFKQNKFDIFKKNHIFIKKSYAISLVCDLSFSMQRHIPNIREYFYFLANVLAQEKNVKMEVGGFTAFDLSKEKFLELPKYLKDSYTKLVSDRHGIYLVNTLYKSFDNQNFKSISNLGLGYNSNLKNSLTQSTFFEYQDLVKNYNNFENASGLGVYDLDNESLEFFLKRLDENVRAKKKLLVYITDGFPGSKNSDQSALFQNLDRTIKFYKGKGIKVLPVNIQMKEILKLSGKGKDSEMDFYTKIDVTEKNFLKNLATNIIEKLLYSKK